MLEMITKEEAQILARKLIEVFNANYTAFIIQLSDEYKAEKKEKQRLRKARAARIKRHKRRQRQARRAAGA